MALKTTLTDLVEVPGPLREYYKKTDDGKFTLDIDPDDDVKSKVSEFRARNVELLKTNQALQAQADADKAKLAELEKAKPDDTLRAELEAERAAHSKTRLAHLVTAEFLRSGGRASAVDFMNTEAAKVFAITDGNVTTELFSATNPSAPLTIEEWIGNQSKVADFCFQPSRGGGARPSQNVPFGARSNQKTLRNPTPQQLGANAVAIAKGDIKIEYS